MRTDADSARREPTGWNLQDAMVSSARQKDPERLDAPVHREDSGLGVQHDDIQGEAHAEGVHAAAGHYPEPGSGPGGRSSEEAHTSLPPIRRALHVFEERVAGHRVDYSVAWS